MPITMTTPSQTCIKAFQLVHGGKWDDPALRHERTVWTICWDASRADLHEQAKQQMVTASPDDAERYAAALDCQEHEGMSKAAACLRAQHALIAELKEKLQNAMQSSGAEAYDIACEELEAYQRKRAAAGKEVGTTNSLVDGMAWIFERLDEIEAQVPPLALTLSETAIKAVGLTPAEAGLVAQLKSYAAAMLTLIEQHSAPGSRVAASSFVTAACESAVRSLDAPRPVIPIHPAKTCCDQKGRHAL